MLYSIITINYNDRKGLEKTIQSLISQTFTDYEFIVIDGGSTDGSVDIIKKYEDKITYWVSEKDNGVYNAMNKGVKQAHGKYLNFMNSGDCFHSQTVLEEISKRIDGCDILIGNCCNADTGKKYGGICPNKPITLLTLMKEIINHQATFYALDVLRKHPYDESLKLISDWKVNVQSIVFDNCQVKVVETLIADYDMTGMSSTQGELHRLERERVLKELLPPRIYDNYKTMFSPEELPIVSLLPQLKQSGRIQSYVYKFAKFLLSLR